MRQQLGRHRRHAARLVRGGWSGAGARAGGHRGHPALNALGVPRTVDFARSDEQRQVMSLLYEELLFSRPYVMAPGAPAERVETIRGAFDATLVDPEFLAEAKRINVEIVDPLTGEELAAIIRRMYATPAGIVAKTRDALRD